MAEERQRAEGRRQKIYFVLCHKVSRRANSFMKKVERLMPRCVARGIRHPS
jgi:hypothetical protein